MVTITWNVNRIEVMGAGSNGIIFDELERPKPGFQVTVYLQVEYLKKTAF